VRRFLHDYSLSIILATLFAVSLAAQWLTHEGTTTEFLNAVMENWQSEFLQLVAFVVLTAIFIHKGSSESKDGDEAVRQQLERIESKLDRLEEARRRLDRAA
jgi:hypothetical protein